MKYCKKCNTKLKKLNLKFTTFVGAFKFIYYCPKCEFKKQCPEQEKIQKNIEKK